MTEDRGGWAFKELEGVTFDKGGDDVVEIAVDLPPPDPAPMRRTGELRGWQALRDLADRQIAEVDTLGPDPWCVGFRSVWARVLEQAQSHVDTLKTDEGRRDGA